MQKRYALPELNNIRHLLLPSAVIFIALLFIMPRSGHMWDTTCWGMWATIINKHGLVAAYDNNSPVNYLPLYVYVLKVYGSIVGEAGMYKYVYFLKSFTLLFDIGSILLLCSLFRSASRRYTYFMFGLFNIGFFYNTLIWNQVDGILAFFVFSSFYFAYKNRTFLSVFLFLLALNFKLQGIVFLPIVGLMWLPRLNLKRVLQLVLMIVLTEVIIILPFLINGNAKNIVKVLSGSVDYFQFISMNAFNLWHLICEGDLMQRMDYEPFIGSLTYKQAGLILFLAFSALVCVPLYLTAILKMLRKQQVVFELKPMVIAAALIACFFFYFNTQMHERYIHPLIIFSTVLAFLYGHWAQWIIFSIAYTLSLEFICQYLQMPKYSILIYDKRFIAGLFSIGILQLLYIWYKTRPFEKISSLN